jgi:hypothetical protein
VIGRSGDMTLQRLVLDFRSDDLLVRCLCCSEASTNAGTRARRREVRELTRTGLLEALEAAPGEAKGAA